MSSITPSFFQAVDIIQAVSVGQNCHTGAVDSETHKIYFSLKNFHGSPLLRIMSPSK